MKVDVTVVLPVFNAEHTLAAAMESVLADRAVALELVVVNDASADDSMAVAHRIRDPRVRVIQNDGPKGVVGAANTGIRAARGPWIARMDADDCALSGRFAKAFAYAQARSEIGVVTGRVEPLNSCGAGMDRYIDWVNQLDDHGMMAANRFVESPVINPSAMVRQDWLEWAGCYRDVPWAEDHDLWLRLIEGGCMMARMPDVILSWRDSPNRLTRADPRYGEAARMAMRAHFLSRMSLIRERGVSICGAGKIGKMLARRLHGEGVSVHAFHEVNRRKHGQIIHGVMVRDAHELSAGEDRPVLLGAVGVVGGRERVRQLACQHGYREGVDYWPIC